MNPRVVGGQDLFISDVKSTMMHVSLASAKYMADRITKEEFDKEVEQLAASFIERWLPLFA